MTMAVSLITLAPECSSSPMASTFVCRVPTLQPRIARLSASFILSTMSIVHCCFKPPSRLLSGWRHFTPPPIFLTSCQPKHCPFPPLIQRCTTLRHPTTTFMFLVASVIQIYVPLLLTRHFVSPLATPLITKVTGVLTCLIIVSSFR